MGRIGRFVGGVLAWILALSTTFLCVRFLPLAFAGGYAVFAAYALAGSAAAWVGVRAWARRRWGVAVVGFLGALLFPWGYLVEIAGPVALGLAAGAGAALMHERRRRGPRGHGEEDLWRALESWALLVGFLGAVGLAHISLMGAAPGSTAAFLGAATAFGSVLAARLIRN